MCAKMKTKESKLEFLYELIACDQPVCYWVYDKDQNLVNGPGDMYAMETIFERTGCKEYMIKYGESHASPIILSAPLGLMWAASYEKNGEELLFAHVMGPVIMAEISQEHLHEILKKHEIPVSWQKLLIHTLHQLPIMPTTRFFHYTLMQHYCITGEHLSISSIHYQQRDNWQAGVQMGLMEKDRKNTYMAERALLSMVRKGQLNYKQSLQQASSLSVGVQSSFKDPLQQAKISGIVFTSLCVRAAIEGGLSPDSSYTRGDAYIRSIEACHTVSEVMAMNHMMYEDFIGCVHKHRINPVYSREIRSACEYITCHITENVTITKLSERAGYTDYYFSRKFKEETGMSVLEYIRIAKMEHAKFLLTTTTESIQKICEQTGYKSRGHFSEHFRQIAGCTPKEYREKNQR